MRYIEYDKIVEVCRCLCEQAAFELPPDVLSALKKAQQAESNPKAAKILGKLIENAQIAQAERIPICQDTGLAVVFVEQGVDVVVQAPGGKSLCDAINAGIACGYEEQFLRKSVVTEPLKERLNTGSNTPVIIHHTIAGGDKLKITLMAKGGGCENKSQFKMFKPTAEKKEVVDWVVKVVAEAGADACPPVVVGVGIGGDFELSCLLSKKALLRNIGVKNSYKFYADLEMQILKKINSLGTGPQGLGGDTTALGCMIETAACHIASLPVAVNIECHSHRHKEAIL